MDSIKQIKEMCISVGDELGKGFSENIYQEGIAVLLRKANIDYALEMTLQVKFRDVYIGNVRADIVLPKEHIVIECKAIDGSLKTSHIPQIINYLEIMKYSKGIFVNFNQNPSKDMVEVILVKRSESGVYEAEMLDSEIVYMTCKGILIQD
jgi:GxxExxY protein